jgi:hypothetical protein
MGRKKVEFRNCANCLHCKQSKNSIRLIVYAFCDVKGGKKERDIEYWNEKRICQKFVDMRD